MTFHDSDGCEFRIGEKYSRERFLPVHPRIHQKRCKVLAELSTIIPPGIGISGAMAALNRELPDFDEWLYFEQDS
jgi:hypothetical protein